ncbi:hypothetical protein [Aggregatibacter actinomycetemcomitans]|uniref:hypothetical protein n=1 Tax=Aggregatibacter actinomycetemcomitans TaxID=714 RepID=UPI00197B8EDE|nr:hypothetical protein [Aggregatibacter actinomycetemcomitans]MBN6059392.1 hypothetical protein [Aggregatibacter actinomycetemcomitans]MBN6087893.1 hypothetical protein [Aggregatibacter actinomycetemcomitans]
MYQPNTTEQIKKDIDFDLNYRSDAFEVIKQRLQHSDYQKEFMKVLEQKYQQKEFTGVRSYLDDLKKSVKNFKEFSQKYFERVDSIIRSSDLKKSPLPEVHCDVTEKFELKKDLESWIKSSQEQNPIYRQHFESAKRDLESFAGGNISRDEMSRKMQDNIYKTAFEDNLRLKSYSNPQLTLSQAETQIKQFLIESYRERQVVENPAVAKYKEMRKSPEKSAEKVQEKTSRELER